MEPRSKAQVKGVTGVTSLREGSHRQPDAWIPLPHYLPSCRCCGALVYMRSGGAGGCAYGECTACGPDGPVIKEFTGTSWCYYRRCTLHHPAELYAGPDRGRHPGVAGH